MNLKKLWMTLKRDFLQCRLFYYVFLATLVLYIGLTVANSYSLFIDDTMRGAISGFQFGLLMIIVMQLGAVLSTKKAAIPLMMLPASNLEKFLSKILIHVVLPVLAIFLAHYATTPVHGNLFAQQFWVENTSENVERFHPEEIEVTNVLTGESYAFRNDSVVVTLHGLSADVVARKYPSELLQVGVSSSTFGDVMFVMGFLGILVFSLLVFGSSIAKGAISVILAGLIIVGANWGFEAVFYQYRSIEAAQTFLLVASTVVGILGLLFFYLAYRCFCNKQLD